MHAVARALRHDAFRLPMKGIGTALAAALLFGASTPLAKSLVADVNPLVLAGLLYAGSGIGLAVLVIARGAAARASSRIGLPEGAQRWWLTAAVAFGGFLAPVLLMFGLQSLAAATASLLLNLEGVLTALIAWFVFRENFDARIALGMGLIVAGGVVLVYEPTRSSATHGIGAVAIAGACLCWAIDNNLTRKISGMDAMVVACVKGVAAGAVNLGLAALLALDFPRLEIAATALLVGFFGYGLSLTLFVVALRHLGAARTGAYFSVAPFFGALLAIVLLGERLSVAIATAGALMTVGVWLHVTERHRHMHTHAELEHTHAHVHDEHHRHMHDFPWNGDEPHRHRHVHDPLTHEHAHYPDLHHRHDHS